METKGNFKFKSNPFTMTFGKAPEQYIDRPLQTEMVISELNSEYPMSNTFMITGVRGCGKTVFLTEISKELRKDSKWIVIPLNPDRDMLTALAGKLYDECKTVNLFSEKEPGISLGGVINASVLDKPVTDIEAVLNKMLKVLKQKGKYLLITVDEAVSSRYMKEFAGAFQILLREDYNIFLLITGLYDNIKNLKDQKTLTFLYRTPQIKLEPLNIIAIKNSYKNVFDVDKSASQRMAELTCGYSFAYQLLGYLIWRQGNCEIGESLLDTYDQFLAEFCYEKIWEELSAKDRLLVKAICYNENGSVSRLLSDSNMNRNEFSVYRDRLIKKGLVVPGMRGKIILTLPRFKSFIENTGANII